MYLMLPMAYSNEVILAGQAYQGRDGFQTRPYKNA
jgi:hypothetical protein